jgi:UDP-N-acetylglucosamine acyltransferase
VDKAGLHRLRAAFRLLFAPGEETAAVFATRILEAKALADDPLVAEMLAFVETPSRRGLVRSAAPRTEED